MQDNTELNEALASNYMLVNVTFRAWGGERVNRKASDELVQAKHATADAATVKTKLLASADTELKAVKAEQVAFRQFVYARTLPWSLNSEGAKRGSRLIATADAMQFLADTAAKKKSHDMAVLELQNVWDQRVAQAIPNLADLADPSVYPSAAEIPDLFAVTVELLPMPSVGDFTRLSVPAPLAEALGNRLAEQTRAQVTNALTDLRDRLTDELKRMVTQLGKAGAGEKTKLYESMLTNTQSLCDLARSMNLTGSQRFNELIDKIEQDLLRYPIETLREDRHTASHVAAQAHQVLTDIGDIDWY